MSNQRRTFEKIIGLYVQTGILVLGILGLRGAYLTVLGRNLEVKRSLFAVQTVILVIISLLLWSGKNRKTTLIKMAIAGTIYGFFVWFCREWVIGGTFRGMEKAVEKINQHLNIHLVLPNTKWVSQEETLAALFVAGILLSLFLGYGILRKKPVILLVSYLIPLVVSGFTHLFPDMLSLVEMLLALGAVIVYAGFEEKPEAGWKAAACSTALSLLVLLAAYYRVLPLLDNMYGDAKNARIALYLTINDELLPKVNEALRWKTWFRDGTIKGNLSRKDDFFYTSAELFEVDVEERPEEVVYLKGFVGNTYTGSAWVADLDERLEDYYGEHGWAVPEDYADLVNLTFNAVQESLPQGEQPVAITVRQIGGSNDYDLYPYGAYLDSNLPVHADGSVDQSTRSVQYQYYPVWQYDRENKQTADGGETAEHYLQYVYDNYLDYPEERLPLLTAWLGKTQNTSGDIYATVVNTVAALAATAHYNLDAGHCPEDRDFVEYFLFEQKEGYCAHFATSAVLMLRRAGIPARYVTGYCAAPMDFVKNEQGTYTAVIEDRQAHAWAEIYLDNVGWVPIESTPHAVALSRDNRQDMLSDLAGIVDERYEHKTEWETDGRESPLPDIEDREESETGADIQPEQEGLAENGQDLYQNNPQSSGTGMENRPAVASSDGSDKGKTEENTSLITTRFIVAAGIFLTIVFAAIAIAVRRLLMRQRWHRMTTNDKVSYFYRQLRRLLIVAGCPEKYEMESDEWTDVMKNLLSAELMEEVREFLCIAQRSSFGEGMTDEETYARAESICRRVGGSVYDGLSRWRKCRVGGWTVERIMDKNIQ